MIVFAKSSKISIQCWSPLPTRERRSHPKWWDILSSRGLSLSLTEQIDTIPPGGKLIFHLMGALAEFERDLVRERTNAG
jgi:hypothetical protein